MPTRVSLAELIDTDIPLRPDEAVAIVREVCRQHLAGELRGIPNATVIRLTPEGRILVEGPVSRDQEPVPAAAALLSDLLPGFHAPAGFKVPGGLRLVLARATHAIDLPPFVDLAEFCGALARFATADLSDTVRHLFHAWAARQAVASTAPSSGELTISDVRRARRATGLSLEDVARASGIPATKLRELEWGYLRNWTADEEGREGLRRYARAAGVDEDLVLSIAWPLIESAGAEPVIDGPTPAPAHDSRWALVPAVTPAAPVVFVRPAARRSRFVGGRRWLVALAAAIVLVITVITMGWERAVPAAGDEGTRADLADARPVSTSGSEPVLEQTRPVAVSGAAAPRPRAARAKARPSQGPARKSFFKRELFRIVIK